MKIDGKEIANRVLLDLKNRVGKLKEKGIVSHLVIILTNNNPASIAYVNQKKIKGKAINAKISIKHLLSDASEPKLLKTIQQFNNDNNVYGIIVQRPLSKTIDENNISLAINPKKDVDGFHPNSKFQMPIAMAVLRIFEEIFTRLHLYQGATFIKWLASQKIAVIGKGETGGKPVINMLRKMNIEPSIIDSKTKNPESITKNADIIISAVGEPKVVKPEMIKREAILIGVGLHKGKDGKLHGDYDEEKIKNIALFYTPTPGGVGPVNVAMLLKNLVNAVGNQ